MKNNLKIEKIVHNGYGLARDNNKTYFIPYTLPDEVVNVKIIKSKKNIDFGIPEKIIKESEHRVKPKCKYFRDCGGCDFQHIDYNKQVKIKEEIIKEFFHNNGIKIENPVKFIPSPEPYHYRINVHLHVLNNQAGYFKKNTKILIPIDECSVLKENIVKFINSNDQFNNISSLIIKSDNSNNISSNIRENKLKFSIDDLNINYDYRCFFQTNQFLIKSWLDIISGYAEPFNKKRIIELYCGVGIISLYLSKQFDIKKITGIDRDNTSINFAKINREKNNLNRVKFKAGKAEKLINDFDYASIVIFNPPRRGIDRSLLLKTLKLNPEAVIYSSCEISTFVRDLKIIVSNGYEFRELTGLDIFPQTYHFEIVGLFVKT